MDEKCLKQYHTNIKENNLTKLSSCGHADMVRVSFTLLVTECQTFKLDFKLG